MHKASVLMAVAAVLAGAASPALSRGHGGDREPAGGAFMTSYPEPGSTGDHRGGPPRSVDIPRDQYGRPYGRMPSASWRR